MFANVTMIITGGYRTANRGVSHRKQKFLFSDCKGLRHAKIPNNIKDINYAKTRSLKNAFC